MKRLLVFVITILMLFSNSVEAEETSIFQKGDYNENIIALHEKLKALGCFSLRAESPWGPESIEALKMLQEKMGWETNGIIANEEQVNMILVLDEKQYHFDEEEIIAKKMMTQIEKNLLNDVSLSDGASRLDNGGYLFVTETEGNSFNAVNWQLLSDRDEYIELIASKGIGVHDGDFLFKLDTGEYKIRVRANSNKKDECITSEVIQFEQNTIYHYVFNVMTLDPTKVEINNIAFGKKKE